MRFTFVILLFCCLGSDAQMIIKAHANYVPFAAGNLLLDPYPGISFAYSFRKLRTAYTGNCIRVRRSNDNAEQDIGFTTQGVLDTASLKTFVGANSGFVTTWYDQSDRPTPRNATQTTAANQPRIVNAGVVDRESGDVALVFDGTNDFLRENFSNLLVANTTLLTVASRRNNANALRCIFSTGIVTGGVSGFGFFYIDNALGGQNNLYMQSRYASQTSRSVGNYTNTINQNHLIFGVTTTTASNAWYNGGNNTTLTYTAETNANSTTNGIIGARLQEISPGVFAPGLYHNGTISEIVVWGSTDQTTNRTAIENNINDYYNIYWNGDFAGLLDSFPSSSAAYSLRNLDKDYLGPLVRVRRSNDNAEQDIFGDYYGNLDTVGLKNFVGANSGFVTIFYDQVTPSFNVQQTTAANQPRIINAGVIDRQNGKPTLVFDGSNDFLVSNANLEITGNFTESSFLTFKQNSTGGAQCIYSTGTDTILKAFSIWSNLRSTNQYDIAFLANDYRTNTSTNTNFQSVNLIKTAGAINTTTNAWFNNTQTSDRGGSSISTPNRGAGLLYLGRWIVSPTSNANMNFSEFILFNNDQSSNRSGIESNINSYYGIY
jgi:hypothetical protein